MTTQLHHLLRDSAKQFGENTALLHADQTLNYYELQQQVETVAQALLTFDLQLGDRVAVYLPKQCETVQSIFACSAAGAVLVPINPALKAAQVQHILSDCDVRVLITSSARYQALHAELSNFPHLQIVLLGDDALSFENQRVIAWPTLLQRRGDRVSAARIDHDIAAILYTSGSTGKPKGVVLSHRNLIAGAESVSSYLNNDQHDRLLAVLPLSFDYGLSQLTTAFRVGASVVLFEYLFAQDVIKACDRFAITGLAAVPPLWSQLAALTWPEAVRKTLRYWTNSGGHLPRSTLKQLREKLPSTTPYLMYGLTEAFRSTYLAPEQIDARPDSIGKAIPNADIRVLRADGSECDSDEPGELVHRGALVALGYWNAPEKTAERFKPFPLNAALALPEIAVFSGDKVRKDRDGFLYFIGRDDELIKSNAYRISPTEIEDVILSDAQVVETVVFGVPHPIMGQAIIAVLVAQLNYDEKELRQCLQTQLPSFMLPQQLIKVDSIARNSNGKFDRAALRAHYQSLYSEQSV